MTDFGINEISIKIWKSIMCPFFILKCQKNSFLGYFCQNLYKTNAQVCFWREIRICRICRYFYIETLSSKLEWKWSPPRNPRSNLSSDLESHVWDLVRMWCKFMMYFFCLIVKKITSVRKSPRCRHWNENWILLTYFYDLTCFDYTFNL